MPPKRKITKASKKVVSSSSEDELTLDKSIYDNSVKEVQIMDLDVKINSMQNTIRKLEEDILYLMGQKDIKTTPKPVKSATNAKKSKNITEWLIELVEDGSVPVDVHQVITDGLGMPLSKFKTKHKKKLKEDKEIPSLIGLVMNELNETEYMNSLITIYKTTKEIPKKDTSSESSVDKKPAIKAATKKAVKKAVPKDDTSSESSNDISTPVESDASSESSDDTPVVVVKKPTKAAAKKGSAKATKKPTKKIKEESSDDSSSESDVPAKPIGKVKNSKSKSTKK